jgi:hypothetical protein
VVIAQPLGASIGLRLRVASLERPQASQRPSFGVPTGRHVRPRLRHFHELANWLPRGGARRRPKGGQSDHLVAQANQHWERQQALTQLGSARSNGEQAPFAWLTQLNQADDAGANPGANAGRQGEDRGDEAPRAAAPRLLRGAGEPDCGLGVGQWGRMTATRVVRPLNCLSLLDHRPGPAVTTAPKVAHLLRPPAAPDQPAPRGAEWGPVGQRMRKVVGAMGTLGLRGLGMEIMRRATRFLSGLEAVGSCHFNGLRVNGLVVAKGLVGARAVVFI